MRVNGMYAWVRHNDVRTASLLLVFALLTQPLAAVVLCFPLVAYDPDHAPFYAWGGYAMRWVPLTLLAAAACFAAQMWWTVRTVRRNVPFRFVDNADEPRLCNLLENLTIAAGMRGPFVGVIDSPAMNAFACGVRPGFSVAVFTRGLIDGLDDDELSAVIAHELVHIRNGDVRLIAAANVFLSNLTLLDRANSWKPRRLRDAISPLFLPFLFPVFIGVALLSQLSFRLGLASRLMISSAREYIADAEAVRLTQNPSALVSALQRIAGRSVLPGLPPEQDAMMIDGMAEGRLATHPSILDRITALAAVTGQMALDARPHASSLSGAGPNRLTNPDGIPASALPALERAAARAEAPRTSSFQAFRRVETQGGLLGIRRDLLAGMAVSFAVSLPIWHGDLGGVATRTARQFGVGADLRSMLQVVRACGRFQLQGILHQDPDGAGCPLAFSTGQFGSFSSGQHEPGQFEHPQSGSNRPGW